MEKKKLPDFRFEKKYWKTGLTNIAGVDEVGRGCFAGPVVTGCVVFIPISRGPATRQPQIHPQGDPGFGAPRFVSPLEIPENIIINDSKKLTPRQRERADKWIRENALAWGIGEVGAGKINKYGMGKAAKMAFRQSISNARKRLGKPIDFLLADAFFISYVPGLPARRHSRQQAIIDGDQKSISVAAASIIAKVYRDRLMQKLAHRPKYRKYGWGRNKGYGTREHQKAIKKYGITRQHRKQFVDTWLRNVSSSRVR